MSLVDARGVQIEPGDTVIYGFGVTGGVAMAEGVVLGEPNPDTWECAYAGPDHDTEHPEDDDHAWVRPEGYAPLSVSLTVSGRVRVRVVRRSYSSGEKPVVDVWPDRLVALKPYGVHHCLPSSPLPTQAETVREQLVKEIGRFNGDLITGHVPAWWEAAWEPYDQYCKAQLKKAQKKLAALDDEA